MCLIFLEATDSNLLWRSVSITKYDKLLRLEGNILCLRYRVVKDVTDKTKILKVYTEARCDFHTGNIGFFDKKTQNKCFCDQELESVVIFETDVYRHISLHGIRITNEVLSDALKNILTRLTTVLTNPFVKLDIFIANCVALL